MNAAPPARPAVIHKNPARLRVPPRLAPEAAAPLPSGKKKS